MSEFNVSSISLNNAQYNFCANEKAMKISVNDSVEIVAILKNKALLKVMRDLTLGSDNDSYVRISCEVVIEHDEELTKEIIISSLRNGSIVLVGAFSKISLLMSQITNISPIGTIITPPTYNPERINVL